MALFNFRNAIRHHLPFLLLLTATVTRCANLPTPMNPNGETEEDTDYV
ncbi:MAG: hypothetical protein ACI974_001350, partial [Paraglaciecola sp.]